MSGREAGGDKKSGREASGDKNPGRVLLVGAGPGDPDLITVRGARALRSADTVVYDALAALDLLDLAPAGAERINVGKRGHDVPTLPQDETNRLLVRLAREGKTVVRLKGGDPFVFGRGGEEASALAEAGIAFEIVPGISSVIGALAYAGIPVTDRRHSASFAVVTGHKDPTQVARDTRWADLAQATDTLVILMGMRNLEGLVDQIVGGGVSPDTPAAVVMDGTLPSQRVVEAPLGELVVRVRAEGLGAPSVIVIGNVVKLRDELSWVDGRPLAGRRVLVTRTPEQAGEWMEALRAAGASTVLMPMIRTEPATDPSALDDALDRLGSYDALLIASANAIRFLAARARERGTDLGSFSGSVVCVGPSSAEATLAEGLPVHTIPAERFDADGMLEAIEKHFPPAGRRFLLPRAEVSRPTLYEGLRAAGATVDAVTAYRTVSPETDPTALRELLTSGRLDVLTFASPSAVRHFMALLDGPSRRALASCVVAAIGPTTAEALRKEGREPDVVPAQANAPGLVAALIESLGTGGSS